MPVRLAVLVLLLLPRALAAQQPLNLGFELASVADSTAPWGWTPGWQVMAGAAPSRAALDAGVATEGRQSLRLTAPNDSAAPLQLQLPGRLVQGEEVRLRLHARHDPGTAALVTLEAWGDRVVPAADHAALGGADTGWVTASLRIVVPADSTIHSLMLQLGARGPGAAWFDGLELEVGGRVLTALPVPPPLTAEARRWLAMHAATLQYLEPHPDTADLAPFLEATRDAALIGLGESTHGTAEFFTLKHRLIAALAAAGGLRHLLLEANAADVAPLEAYLQGGPGTARDAVARLYPIMQVEEVAALAEGLRIHNRAHPGAAVHAVGFDVQDQAGPAGLLRRELTEHDAAWLPRLDALTAEYAAAPSFFTPGVPAGQRLRWAAQADTLERELAARLPRWGRAAATAAMRAREAARAYRQAAWVNATGSSALRDTLMAENVVRLVEAMPPGTRAALWAHDGHVGHGGDHLRSLNGGAQMGAALRGRLGTRYRAYAFLTARGTYRAMAGGAFRPVPLFPAPAASHEAALDALARVRGTVALFLPLTGAPARELETPRPLRSIGYMAMDFGFEPLVSLPLDFDGVFFVPATRAATGLR